MANLSRLGEFLSLQHLSGLTKEAKQQIQDFEIYVKANPIHACRAATWAYIEVLSLRAKNEQLLQQIGSLKWQKKQLVTRLEKIRNLAGGTK